MPNIKAFRPVVHEKMIFEDLTKFSLLGPKSESASPKHVSHQV